MPMQAVEKMEQRHYKDREERMAFHAGYVAGYNGEDMKVPSVGINAYSAGYHEGVPDGAADRAEKAKADAAKQKQLEADNLAERMAADKLKQQKRKDQEKNNA